MGIIYKKYKYVIALLLIAFIFRLILSVLPAHVDILSVAGWGRWIFFYGPSDFYQHNIWLYSWPTQPPLVNLLYASGYFLYEQFSLWFVQIGHFIAINRLGANYIPWFYDFVIWFQEVEYLDTDYPVGFIISLKFFGVIADILIALIIFFIAKKASADKPLIFPAVYLFSPFTFYLSSLWGQYDQLGFLFTLISFLALLNKKTIWFAPVLLAFSVDFKPTSLIFVPLFIWIYFRQKPSILMFIFGLISSIGIICLTSAPFVKNKTVIDYILTEIIPRIFYKSEFRVSSNAFNFWHILIGNKVQGLDWTFLFMPVIYWAYFLFGVINLLAFKITRIVNSKNIFTAMFIIGFGSWLFLTNMLERYLFAGVSAGLILIIFYPKIFKYWLFLSIIYWINLYHGWWYPEIFDPLRQILIWQDGLITRILSFINVLLYIKIVIDLGIFPSYLKKFTIKSHL